VVVTLGAAITVLLRDEAAMQALGEIGVLALVPVAALQLVNLASDSIRYRMVLPRAHRHLIPWMTWHRIFGIGRLLNSVVPQSGLAYRTAQLKIRFGVPISTSIGSIVAISWMGNGIALILAAGVVFEAAEPGPALALLAIGLGILGLVAYLPRLDRSSRAPFGRRIPDRVRRLARHFSEAFVELARTPGRATRVLAVSLLTQTLGAATFVLIAGAIGVADPLRVGVVLYASITTVTVVSLTPGGLGITELTAALVGSVLDIGGGVAVLIALVSRVVSAGALLVFTVAASAGERLTNPSRVRDPG
jgi:uncharacterized membrane protein YbhN (UPF0104 family)